MTSRTGKHNYNTYIAQYVIKQRQSVNELGQVVEFNLRNIFLHKSCRKWGDEITSRLLFGFKKKLYIKLDQLVSALVLILAILILVILVDLDLGTQYKYIL